ncbi:MAG: hypothetical protein ACP5OC_07355 [Thermoplasmata archaeon]
MSLISLERPSTLIVKLIVYGICVNSSSTPPDVLDTIPDVGLPNQK